MRDTENRTRLDRVTASGLPLLPPLSGLVELAVLTGLILGFAALFPEVELVDIQPNPFWLPVLLLSLQYGTLSGLIAAGLAIAVIFSAGVPEEAVGENHFSFISKIWAQPILWIGAALLLGQFRMRQITAKQELTRRVEELSGEREALAGHAGALRARLEGLERERAGECDIPAVRVLAALAKLNRTSGDVAPAFREAIASAFPSGAASVFLARASGLTLIAEMGWAEVGRTEAGKAGGAGSPTRRIWARELAPAHPLVRAVVGEGRAVSVLVAGEEAALAGEGLAAVPLRAGKDGGVIGLLKLEACDPQALTATTVLSLEVIAEALARGLGPDSVRDRPDYDAPSEVPPPLPARARARRPWRLWSGSSTSSVAGEAEAGGAQRPRSGSAVDEPAGNMALAEPERTGLRELK